MPPGSRVFLQGCSGESDLWRRWLQRHQDSLQAVCFAGVLIPGINSFDYSELGDACELEVIFMQPSFRRGYEAGRIRYLPITYSSTVQYYERGQPFDLCLLQASPANARGEYSLGTSADFAPSALKNCRRVAVHVNPRMPFTAGPVIQADRIDVLIEADTPLLQQPVGEVPDVLSRVAVNVSELIEDGDTLQFGLGKLQQAICNSLGAYRGLKVHSGMISDPLLAPLDAGAIDAVVTGTAIGTNRLYGRCTDRRLRFAPVSHTHAAETLYARAGLKCINAVMQIDLLGQGNSEWIAGRQVSGCGGLMDFGRGCRQRADSAFILAMPSTIKGGSISTIVPLLPGNTGVSVTRQDVDYLVTEHGIADLRYRDVRDRAQALIAVADPAHRDHLASAWHDDIARRI